MACLRAGAAEAVDRLRRVGAVEACGGARGNTLVGGDIIARRTLKGAIVSQRRVEVVAKTVEEPTERQAARHTQEGRARCQTKDVRQ